MQTKKLILKKLVITDNESLIILIGATIDYNTDYEFL